MFKRISCFLLLLSSCAYGAVASLEPCVLEKVSGPARCGSHEVFENREKAAGRKIPIYVAVLPTLSEQHEPDPLFILQGGPGQSAIKLADFYAEAFSAVRQHRDIVLVDQRGTGKSHPLMCNFADPSKGLQGYLGELFPSQQVQDCRKQLEASADLAQYTTSVAMDDLDEIRAWLGYDKINIYGTSYGTYAAQVYMQRHADHLRSAVLKAVAPINELTMLRSAANSQHALDLLFSDCTADENCHKAFPNLATEFEAILKKLDHEPARVTLADPETKKPVDITLSRGALAVTLRTLLHSPDTDAKLPKMIHQAFNNDFKPFAEIALMVRKRLPVELSFGMFLSVECSEEIPLIDVSGISEATKGTFTGSYWIDQIAQACKEWPRGKALQLARSPLAQTPVLLISGGLDPVTPPSLAESAARLLPHGRHLVVAKAGHPFQGLIGCADILIAEFINKGSADALDFSCADKLQRPPFEL